MLLNPTQYQLRKLIIEIKHPANLLHSQKVGQILQDIVPDFDQVIQKNETFELISNKTSFRKLICGWDRLVYLEEKLPDVETGIKNAKHYLGHVLPKLGVEIFERVGIRNFYIIPCESNYKNLLEWYNSVFLNSMNLYSAFGTITDSAVAGFSGSDERYKFNLTVATFDKNEFVQKLSDFKNEPDQYNTAFLVDLDLYLASKSNYKPLPVIEDAMNQSRIKTIQFFDKLFPKK